MAIYVASVWSILIASQVCRHVLPSHLRLQDLWLIFTNVTAFKCIIECFTWDTQFFAITVRFGSRAWQEDTDRDSQVTLKQLDKRKKGWKDVRVSIISMRIQMIVCVENHDAKSCESLSIYCKVIPFPSWIKTSLALCLSDDLERHWYLPWSMPVNNSANCLLLPMGKAGHWL